MYLKCLPAAALAAGIALPGFALATNGMIMEGYGPVATAMGGAAMAYDNGTAAMANNPATMGQMTEGSRLDVALGFIGPNVSAPGSFGDSKADAFYMPAFGYTNKRGSLSYGIGIYAQGGMGTEYASGDMSQVGVGRVILPLAYNVTDRLSVGGSVDIVWAGMDIVADLDGNPATKEIDFKDGSDYTGAAKGYGLAMKLGFTYKVNEQFSLGGVYETAGNLGSLEDGGWKVKGFDMPPIVAVGAAWRPSDKLLLVADLKDVMWNSSMNTVTILNNGVVVAPFVQNWDDQIVVSIGAAYKFTDAVTGRIGYNHADNPIPSQNMNYLWPATVEDHYTFGLGYAFDKASEVNFSLSYVPEVSQTGTGAAPPAGNGGIQVTHSQTNWQLMYSKKF
ncbi:MAG: outer membrane protein transport protein [Hydrogenophilaceae bacterium]|nr:outer membrane protein transport protein [Hydrogenophilaceae bacterium]